MVKHALLLYWDYRNRLRTGVEITVQGVQFAGRKYQTPAKKGGLSL